MRSPAEIMGEHSNDEWTAYDWKCVHDAIRAAQREALEEVKQLVVNEEWPIQPQKNEWKAGYNTCRMDILRWVSHQLRALIDGAVSKTGPALVEKW